MDEGSVVSDKAENTSQASRLENGSSCMSAHQLQDLRGSGQGVHGLLNKESKTNLDALLSQILGSA